MEFPRFQWWAIPIWSGKDKGIDNNSSDTPSNSIPSYGYGFREPDTVKFPFQTGTQTNSNSPRKVKKKKWQSREDRRIDKEHDVVLVPADGVCLSGSETDDSDWSIGWLEPHGSDFLSDDETDDSFAVLVPCYRNDKRGSPHGPNSHLLNAIKNLTNDPFSEEKNFMEQWLSSLHNF